MERVDKRYPMLEAITKSEHKVVIDYVGDVGSRSRVPIEWAIKLYQVPMTVFGTIRISPKEFRIDVPCLSISCSLGNCISLLIKTVTKLYHTQRYKGVLLADIV